MSTGEQEPAAMDSAVQFIASYRASKSDFPEWMNGIADQFAEAIQNVEMEMHALDRGDNSPAAIAFIDFCLEQANGDTNRLSLLQGLFEDVKVGFHSDGTSYIEYSLKNRLKLVEDAERATLIAAASPLYDVFKLWE